MSSNGNGKSNTILLTILIGAVTGVGGWTIKQALDIERLKSDHIPARRIEKHFWYIEKQLGLDPKNIDNE